MELVMMAEPPEAMDAVEVEATPSLRLVVPGGLHGDVATASLLARWAWVVARYPGPAGLLTVRDLPLWPREMEERK
jgi:4-hydroxy-tetrahydrodipicolinate reductase